MLARFDRSSPSQEIMDTLERDGGVIVERFLEPAVVDRLVGDFTPHLEGAEWCNTEDGDPEDKFFGLKTKRLHGLLGRSAALGEVLIDPLLLAMCERFLEPSCRAYRVSTAELIALGPGEATQSFHRDADSWKYLPQPRRELLVSANIALTDFTEDNGATVVVPKSHRWPRERRVTPDEIARAVMPRGSVLLYSGDVLHSGGANHTDEIRIGLYIGYIVSWLRSIENHLITCGAEAIRAAPESVRELLDVTDTGFSVIA